jgi:hypothetical protein
MGFEAIVGVIAVNLETIAREMIAVARQNTWNPLLDGMFSEECRRDIPYQESTYRIQCTMTKMSLEKTALQVSVGDRSGQMMSEETANEFKKAFFGDEQVMQMPSSWEHVIQWVKINELA